MASSLVSISVAISTNMSGKGLSSSPRKGAGNHQPVSPPVARGAVAADVDRSRSRCAACSRWLACVDCITSVRLRQCNAIREARLTHARVGQGTLRTPVKNPTAIHDSCHSGCPVNTFLKLETRAARQESATIGGGIWSLPAEPLACDGDFTSILHRRDDRSHPSCQVEYGWQ